jgi:hypothetical protein
VNRGAEASEAVPPGSKARSSPQVLVFRHDRLQHLGLITGSLDRHGVGFQYVDLADIEGGCVSAALIHLAQISYRLGRTLHFDSKTLSCTGDEEANRMFTRNYRSTFAVPGEV